MEVSDSNLHHPLQKISCAILDTNEASIIYPLHYHIAFLGEEKTCEYIDTEVKNFFFVQTNSHLYGFTPLHLAVIFGQKKTVTILIKKIPKEALEKKDIKGWTPFHHTVWLQDAKIKNILLKAGANLEAKTNYYGTLADFEELTGKTVCNPSSKTTTICFSEKGKKVVQTISSLSKKTLKKLTGLKEWIDSPIFQDPFDLWEQEYEALKCSYQQRADQKFTDWRKNPPLLHIQKCKKLTTIDSFYPWEVVSGQDIETGTILGEYTGKKFIEGKPQPLDPIYKMESISAKKEGNVTRFFNNGLPKTMIVGVILRGTVRLVAVVVDPLGIKKGESILIDYSINYKRSLEANLIFGKENLFFFKEKNKENIFFEWFKKNLDTWKEHHNFLLWVYPLNNPSLLFYLHFKNFFSIFHYVSMIFHYQDLQEKEDLSSYFQFMKEFVEVKKGKYVISMIFFLAFFEKNASSSIKKEAKNWILKNIEKKPTAHLILYLQSLLEKKELPSFPIFDWENFYQLGKKYQEIIKKDYSYESC